MIPVNEPLLNGREKELLMQCIDSGWISSDGPFVEKFESIFSSYLGSKYGIAVCNGTAALETALYAAGIKKGDEIIMPSFTIISCAIAAIRLGAKPVLVDIDPDIWTMDVSQIKNKITSKTKAILPVHMYGHPVDMDPIFEIAAANNLMVIEDAAEVHGAEYKGRKCGSMGNVAAFSFYANKIITTGEGGMVVTNDRDIAEKARSYRNLCFLPEKRFYHHEMGYNFRMTNLQAAIGVAQMERIDEFIGIKRRLGEVYRRNLAKVPGVRFQIEKEWAKSVYWMYSVEIDELTGLNAESIMRELNKKGIGTRPFFFGMHEQPVFNEMGLFVGESYPHTERASRQGFYLPSGLKLTEEEVLCVCEELASVMKEKSSK